MTQKKPAEPYSVPLPHVHLKNDADKAYRREEEGLHRGAKYKDAQAAAVAERWSQQESESDTSNGKA